MKKIIALVLVVVSIVSSFTVAYGTTKDIERENLVTDSSSLNYNSLSALKSSNIEVIVNSDNKIVLKNANKESIEKANQILRTVTLSGYPTPWYPLKNYSYVTSKKFRAATEAAFLAVIGAWWVDGVLIPATLAKSASFAFGTYYFVERDEENIYYSKKYQYRELSAGSFDSMGNFIGDYQISKVERTTLDSSGTTGGQTLTKYEYTSILVPGI